MATNETRIRIAADDKASRVIDNVRRELLSMSAVGSRLSGLVSPLGAVAGGVAALGAGAVALRNFVGRVDDLVEASEGLGVTAVALAEMRSRAVEAGIGANVLDNALGKLNAKIAEAASGNAKAAGLFKAMGVEVRDAGGNVRGTEAVLRDIADRFATYANTAERGALAARLFGDEAGRRMVPLLSQGAGALRQYTGLTEDMVRDTQRLQGELDKLATRWDRVTTAVLGYVAAGVNAFADAASSTDINEPSRRLERLTALIDRKRDELARERRPEFIEAIRLEIDGMERDAAALAKSIGTVKQQLLGVRGYGEGGTRAPLPSDDDDKKAGAAKSFLETLRKQAQAIGVSEFEAKRLEAAQLGVARASEPYIQRLEQAKTLLADVARANRQQEEEQKAATERTTFAFGLEERGRAMQFEADVIGRTRREVEQLTAAREIDAAVARENWKTDSDAAIAANEAAGERAKAIANRAIETRLVNEQQQAIDELLADIAEETLLIGASNAERARAALLRQLDAAGIDKQSQAYEDLLKRLQLVADAIDLQDVVRRNIRGLNDLGDAIAGNAENAVVEFTNLRDLLGAIEQDILRIVTRQLVTEPLGKGISDILKGIAGPGGGVGDIFGKIGSIVFGGGKAAGGPVYGNVPYLVGERGPELFVPRSSGQIVNAQDTRRLGMTVNNYITVPAGTSGATANQIATDVARKLMIVQARGLV